MSDGPHRSLNMHPRWKAVAKCADTAAFTAEEVAQAIPPALAQDWNKEINTNLIKRMQEIFREGLQKTFFAEDKTDRLEALRKEAAGMPLGNRFIDNAIYASRQGLNGLEALYEAVKHTLYERVLSGIRQIEEHYCRESNTRRAANVRARMESGIAGDQINKLASDLLSPRSGKKSHRLSKQTGLDDGVQL